LGKAWGVLFMAIFSWPVLRAFDLPGTLFGVPSFLVCAFLLWAVLVYVLVAVSRRSGR
jgi:hypothetical protein